MKFTWIRKAVPKRLTGRVHSPGDLYSRLLGRATAITTPMHDALRTGLETQLGISPDHGTPHARKPETAAEREQRELKARLRLLGAM